MVYCVNCGSKNPDEAVTCSQCGKSIMKVEGEKAVQWHEYPFARRSHWGGILVGLFLIIIGVVFLFEQFVPFIAEFFWPLVLIFVGTAIILNGFRRRSRQ